MAIPRPAKKDYKVCEFCKMNPCMYVRTGEVEYGDKCRSYIADARKISNDKEVKKVKFVVN